MPRKKVKIQNETEIIKNIDRDEEERPTELRTVMTIFRESNDLNSHERLLSQLAVEFYDKLFIDEFCQDFFECMRHIMIYQDRFKTEIPILFCINFVILCLKKDMTFNKSTNSALLLKRMVKFINYYDDSTDSNTRFHSVQSTRILLTELTDDITVPDLLFEKIQTHLLKRFWDVKSFIRVEAARASSRLQDPTDPDCPIVIALMHLSRFDGCHTVRLAAMEALAITTKTLPCIVARSRDINDLVRKKSFDLMSKWKILKPLTISKRLQIVESGLTDKSDMVKNACKELLMVWLIASNNDPVTLLKRFDVENKEDITELAFTELLKSLSSTEKDHIFKYLLNIMNEKCVINEEFLSAESAFLWKNIVIFITDHSVEYGNYLEKILPSVPDFEQYLRNLFQKPIDQSIQKEISLDEYAEYCTIIKQLLQIIKYMDIFDIYNRQKIIDLIKWAMSSTDIPFNYVEHLMKLLVHLESNNVKICDETVALINELLFDNEMVNNCNQINVSKDQCMPIIDVNVEPKIVQNSNSLEVENDHTVVNMEALRRKRIEIVELDVKINELKEMITTSMQAKEFDGVQVLVNELKNLESKKSELILIKEQLMSPVINNGMHEMINEPVEVIPTVKMETQEIISWMTPGMESRIIKANIMTISMIQECNLLWSMPSSLRSLFDNVILTSVKHTDACVREKAILSLGLCCLLDKELALKYYPIFLKCLEVDHEQIKDVAIKSLIDIFIRFGIEPFQEALIASKENSRMLEQNSVLYNQSATDIKHESFVSCNTTCSVQLTEEEQNKCVSELINPIIHLLNSDKIELQTTATVGLSKLLYYHKLLSSKLLSKLLLLWFNPETETNILLRQHLSAFFTNYTLMSAANQEAIANCFMITMKTLFKAPASSALSEIDISNVVDFFLRSTDSRYLLENRIETNKINDNCENTEMPVKDLSQLANPCHNELALTISNQILKAPLSSEVKYYVSMLSRLRLSLDNATVIHDVEEMVATMIKKLKDKKSIQLLEKFHKEILSKFNINKDSLESTRDNITLADMDVEVRTPKNKPLLLEVNTCGQPHEGRFLNHTAINVDEAMSDVMSEISSINMDHTLMDQTMADKDWHLTTIGRSIITKKQSPIVISNDLPTTDRSQEPNTQVKDDDIFKKPRNIRVTRSSFRQSQSSISLNLNDNVNSSVRKAKN